MRFRLKKSKGPLISAAIALGLLLCFSRAIFADPGERQPGQPIQWRKADPQGPQGSGLQIQQTIPSAKRAPEIYVPECGQSCAFNIAGQASTALGYYIQRNGPFASPEIRQKAAENIKNCMLNANASNCEKDKLVETVIQYNFARNVRQMIVENQTNEKNLKSVDAPTDPKKLNNLYYHANDQWTRGTIKALEVNAPPRQPYKFTVDKNFGISSLNSSGKSANQAAEKEILGLFLQDYKQLIHAYSDADKNTFTKVTKLNLNDTETNQVAVEKVRPGAVMQEVDSDKQNSIANQMSNPNIRKVMKDFETELAKVKSIPFKNNPKTGVAEIDITPLKTSETGIGTISKDGKITSGEQDDYKNIALEYNQAVDKTFAEKKASSTKSGKTLSSLSVVLDINEFDKFLDEIWPPDVKR